LFLRPETKEIELFYREKQQFSVHKTKFKVGNYLVKNGMVRANALLLSVAGQFNDKTAIKIFNWLKKLDIVSGLHSELYTGVSVHQLKNELQKKEILEFIKAADLGIDDLSPQLLDPDNLPKDLPTELTDLLKKTFKENKNAEFFYDIMTNHKVYNDDNEFIKYTKLSMKADESEGTKKYFALSGLILDALQTGKILVIDELDAKLHPNLVSKLVELFNSKDKNRHGAQLICNTHDTNLLSAKLFRRDQIWFTEKDRYGAVTLYSLHDFMLEDGDKVRKGADFETNYIKGRYGAIPYLNDFEYLLAI
jgi:AAA15 family ATPase/GTPase